MYYEVKLKVMKPNKDGLEKEVKEHFITDCSLLQKRKPKGLNSTHPIIWNLMSSPFHVQTSLR